MNDKTLPDMTNWPPEYIREFLADRQKAFEADQRTNRALNAIPPDDRAAREQMSPGAQIRYYDALKRQRGSDAAKPRTLANLGEQPGVPLAALGDQLGDPRAANPTLQQAMAMNRAAPGPFGPMPTDEQIQAYLRMTGQIYPPLTTQVNPVGWEAFLAQAPESLNIDDRRGINRRR